MTAEKIASRKGRGGRPKVDPSTVRTSTIGVRVSAEEYALLRTKAQHMGMVSAQWLRAAALSRRLPSPPVAPVNREQYGKLATLSANLNQLTRLANEGRTLTVSQSLLQALTAEVRRLRLGLLGIHVDNDP